MRKRLSTKTKTHKTEKYLKSIINYLQSVYLKVFMDKRETRPIGKDKGKASTESVLYNRNENKNKKDDEQ